jgi:phosphoribosyl 1,2-cyclic phosphodiesterase
VHVTFWGTRGSIASPGPRTVRHGGNTSCVEVRSNSGTLIICDSGTGIRELGVSLMSTPGPVRGHVLLSHTHWDHIQGWPFFTPAFVPGNEFTLHGLAGTSGSLNQVLANQMEYTYFPVTLEEMRARIQFEEVREGEFVIDDVKVTALYLNHTCVCLGYRFEADGQSVVYATDTEPHGLRVAGSAPDNELKSGESPHLVHKEDVRLADFARGADLLIMDAQYTDEEYPNRIGWGHCTTSYTTDIGVHADAQRLALYHHDPTRRDDMVDEIVATAAARAASYGSHVEIFGAAEGQTVQL